MIKQFTFLFFIIILTSCNTVDYKKNSPITAELKAKKQATIIEKYVDNCAHKYNYNVSMSKWQGCLDKGLKEDSTVAYLWQQKAMPYFKAKKYEMGMLYIDKAVIYNPKRWQPYRVFIKCIFAKTHKAAIINFEACKKRDGNSYVMDHPYSFYIGLSYLQLNEYEKAEKLFQEYVNELFDKLGENWVHPTALFYLGISKYELEKYDEAITQFNRALNEYPTFSDVKYYKAICLNKIGNFKDSEAAYKEYIKNKEEGYTLNEDNAIYEVYPYQKK